MTVKIFLEQLVSAAQARWGLGVYIYIASGVHSLQHHSHEYRSWSPVKIKISYEQAIWSEGVTNRGMEGFLGRQREERSLNAAVSQHGVGFSKAIHAAWSQMTLCLVPVSFQSGSVFKWKHDCRPKGKKKDSLYWKAQECRDLYLVWALF